MTCHVACVATFYLGHCSDDLDVLIVRNTLDMQFYVTFQANTLRRFMTELVLTG